MDGVALDSRAVAAGARSLHLQGTQAAGDPPLTLASPTSCIEVMTGAVLPVGCDCVIPVEDLETRPGRAGAGSECARGAVGQRPPARLR